MGCFCFRVIATVVNINKKTKQTTNIISIFDLCLSYILVGAATLTYPCITDMFRPGWRNV